ncbi:MAG: T9SS type A sorting domain-containing protein [Bacteroidota bacterium]
MKKFTLLVLFLLTAFSYDIQAQTDFVTVLPNNGGTSQNGRAPKGDANYNRAVWLITAAEMSAAGYASGSVVTSIGFNLSVAQDIPTTGNFTVYLENTVDATNTKSTTWATAISTMTTVSTDPLTIPAAVGTYDHLFNGGTSFTYTGGALYVAFDYQNAAGPLASSPNTALCNSSLAGGLKGAFGATVPATVAASAFRPETRLGVAVACVRPQGLNAVTTTNSADLSWTSTATTFDIEYGPSGFVQGTGTLVTGVTANPYTITLLSSGTAYDFYVRADCGGGALSAYNGPYTFLTSFDPADPTYMTGFEQATLPEIGWSANPIRTATNAGWYVNVSAGLSQDGDDHTAVSLSDITNTADARLFSRGINLKAGYQATIDYYVQNYQAGGSTTLADYDLTVGNAQNAASQTTTISSEIKISNLAGEFLQKTFTYNTPVDGVYYFSFWNKTGPNATGTHALIIDAFTVSEALLGTKDFISSKFSVSPNPANNVIKVSNSENINVTAIAVTDLNGRVVKQQSYTDASNIQINVSDLSTGMYLMKITSDKGTAVKKIIKN